MKKTNEVAANGIARSGLGWSGAGSTSGALSESMGSLLYEWPHWEGIMHHFMLGLIVYAMYRFATQTSDRTLANILLFTVVVGLDAQLHHMINVRSGRGTSYGI